jgi:hypothetical protein
MADQKRFNGDVTFNGAVTNTAGVTVTGDLTATGTNKVANLQASTDGANVELKQFDGKTVAQIHDGALLPVGGGSSPTISSQSVGFGMKRRVVAFTSTNDDNTFTLTARDSGSTILLTNTNNMQVNLPAAGTDDVGMFFTFVVLAKNDKSTTIKTSGAGGDNNDNFSMWQARNVDTSSTDAINYDGDGDTLQLQNVGAGTVVEMLCIAGGANESWGVQVYGSDTVAATVADS